MQQNISYVVPTGASDASCRLPTSWHFIRSYHHVFLYFSLVLLVLSAADSGPLGGIAKLFWLASVASLTVTNIGAAFATYVGSLAIYSPLHFVGWGSPFERPDNYALVIVLVGMLVLAFHEEKARSRLSTYILVMLLFVLLHGAIFDGFSRGTFAGAMRAIGIPFLICALLAVVGLRERELDAFQTGMVALGSYTGIVSILQRMSVYNWILPPGSAIHISRPATQA